MHSFAEVHVVVVHAWSGPVCRRCLPLKTGGVPRAHTPNRPEDKPLRRGGRTVAKQGPNGLYTGGGTRVALGAVQCRALPCRSRARKGNYLLTEGEGSVMMPLRVVLSLSRVPIISGRSFPTV